MASMQTCTTCNQKYENGFIGMVGQAILPEASKRPGEPGPVPVNSSTRDERRHPQPPAHNRPDVPLSLLCKRTQEEGKHHLKLFQNHFPDHCSLFHQFMCFAHIRSGKQHEHSRADLVLLEAV